MKVLVLIVCLASLSCASTPIPLSTAPVDWNSINDHWSLHVVTTDPDGDERVTRVWIALVDGEGTIRTNESRWWSNLERDPAIRIRLSGTDHSFHAESVTDHSGRELIDEAFLEKYGAWERMAFSQDRGETHDNYARLRPPRN